MSQSRFLNSPYIRCQPMSQAACRPLVCYYCGRLTRKGTGQNAIDATSDHVVARAHYPEKIRPIPREVMNRRPCCYFCNQNRALLGHCCGLLMMVLIESTHRGHTYDCFGEVKRIVFPALKLSWRERARERRKLAKENG